MCTRLCTLWVYLHCHQETLVWSFLLINSRTFSRSVNTRCRSSNKPWFLHKTFQHCLSTFKWFNRRGRTTKGGWKREGEGGENWRDFFNFRWTVYFKMWWELCDDERKFFADFKDFFFLILLRGNFFWYYCLGIRLFLIVKLAQKNVQCCSTFDESE